MEEWQRWMTADAPPYAPYLAARPLGERDGLRNRGLRDTPATGVPRSLRRIHLLGLNSGLRAQLAHVDIIACLEYALSDLRALPADISCGYMAIGELVALLRTRRRRAARVGRSTCQAEGDLVELARPGEGISLWQ
jgi:hypothetical protein